MTIVQILSHELHISRFWSITSEHIIAGVRTGKSMRTGKSHELVQTHASMYHPVFSTARSPSDGAVADVAVEPQSQTIELKPAPRPLALRSSFLPFKNSFLALPLNAVLRGMLYPSRAYAAAISSARASSTNARATFSHDQMVDVLHFVFSGNFSEHSRNVSRRWTLEHPYIF